LDSHWQRRFVHFNPRQHSLAREQEARRTLHALQTRDDARGPSHVVLEEPQHWVRAVHLERSALQIGPVGLLVGGFVGVFVGAFVAPCTPHISDPSPNIIAESNLSSPTSAIAMMIVLVPALVLLLTGWERSET
jgi:hypothetical protein